MKLVILDNVESVADWSANYVIEKINNFVPTPNKNFVLGLPTGGYNRLAAIKVHTYTLKKKF